MPSLWRILKAKHAETAFDGEGARRFGGRWNYEGDVVVYASGSLSLAALELLVLLESAHILFELISFQIIVPKIVQIESISQTQVVKSLKNLTTQDIGAKWLAESTSCILQIPSVIIPTESNYMINPNHKHFKQLNIKPPEKFSFDKRIKEKLKR